MRVGLTTSKNAAVKTVPPLCACDAILYTLLWLAIALYY
jgi:hypothetical protein